MYIYDSVAKKKVIFSPIKEGMVRVYVCGPTVYNSAHLGHARSAVSFDILVRTLREIGYQVLVARNFTDIDDKIINRSKSSGMSIEEITSKYMKEYSENMEALLVLKPDFEPKATEYIQDMVTFIEGLVNNGAAYKVENGDVYLDTTGDRKYGTLSGNNGTSDTRSRIESVENKRNSRDFVLWKAGRDRSEVGFDSSIGYGRPGWHIECSTMIEKVLSYKDSEYCIDIHAGGQDLLFPHHENEASQTRSLHNQELSKYWMHNGFVTINGEKMSKSLGNSFFIKDALSVYHGEVIRNYLLGTHYRAMLNFSEQDLIESKKRLDKIYRLKKRVAFDRNSADIESSHSSSFGSSFIDAMKDDLNVSLALSCIEDMIKDINEKLDSNCEDTEAIKEACSNIKLIQRVLGIGTINPEEYFLLGISPGMEELVKRKIDMRITAKLNKDFKLADSIRAELEELGVRIMDKANNVTEWEYHRP